VSTLAFLPLSICAVVAGRVLAGPDGRRRSARRAGLTVLLLGGGWIGYVAIPYVLSWGPVLLVLIVCCGAAAVSSRRGMGSPRTL
jgi:hypothetical protein